ncbi:hypothetical protein ACQP1G_05855 [Nocardia sp. CA-107356]|uniref:hypothetical protein n=1 Tax=Nocardia sp. CA-107356 TaxID=3239972 RepID=UPI003D8F0977
MGLRPFGPVAECVGRSDTCFGGDVHRLGLRVGAVIAAVSIAQYATLTTRAPLAEYRIEFGELLDAAGRPEEVTQLGLGFGRARASITSYTNSGTRR